MNSRASLEPAYVPCSTYRLQLNLRFTFTQAAAVVAYLHDLGITDCYTSPVPDGPSRQHARLRRHRSHALQSRNRFGGTIHGIRRTLEATRYGPGRRCRSQSHVHHPSFQSLVVGCAGERAQLRLFPPFRYRLESSQIRAGQQSPAAVSARPVWTGSGKSIHSRLV